MCLPGGQALFYAAGCVQGEHRHHARETLLYDWAVKMEKNNMIRGTKIGKPQFSSFRTKLYLQYTIKQTL